MANRRMRRFGGHALIDQPRLTREQEIDLGDRARHGDREARDTMILSCYPMVYTICSQLKCNPSDRDDMAQAAMIGLIRSVDAYDPLGGARLSTWTYTAIRFAASNWRQSHDGRKRQPMTESCHYLDEIATDSGEPDIERREEQAATAKRIRQAMEGLKPRERTVLECRCLRDEPETLREVAGQLGVTKTRAQQIQVAAMRYVRIRLEATA